MKELKLNELFDILAIYKDLGNGKVEVIEEVKE